jgi:Protein of unknown function (DUF3592)
MQVTSQTNASNNGGMLDKADGCINFVRNGCIWLVINLFFAAFIGWAGFHAYSSYLLVTNGERATGTVVRLEESSSSEGGTVYSPVIEFSANGQTYSFESGNASDPPTNRVGDQVPVLYDPEAPEQARIESFYELWLFPAILIPVMGIAIVIVNIVFLVMAMRGQLTKDHEGDS